jgi:hypothetical protein
MQINDKDAGAYLRVVSGGGARGVAAGTGDNTEVFGEIVDQNAEVNKGLRSGLIFVAGQVTLTATNVLDINDVKIEHSDASNMAGAVDLTAGKNAVTSHAAVALGGGGGTTEVFGIKQRIDLWGVKRYWRVSIIPDCDAGSADVFELGFGVVAIGESAPLS